MIFVRLPYDPHTGRSLESITSEIKKSLANQYEIAPDTAIIVNIGFDHILVKGERLTCFDPVED